MVREEMGFVMLMKICEKNTCCGDVLVALEMSTGGEKLGVQ